MMKKIWERRNAEGGFTLIELLIVIVILGVLAGVAVFALSGSATDSKKAACKSDVATVQTAADAYYAKNGAWAASITALKNTNFLRSDPSTKTVAADGYALTYSTSDGTVGSNPANCAVT